MSEVPWVGGRAVYRIVALPVRQAHRHIGLAEYHGTGRGQTLDRQRVLGGDVVAILLEAPGAAQAGDVEALLHRHRHAEQRAGTAIAPLLVEHAGTIARAVEVAHHNGIGPVIEPLDAGDIVVEQLEAADGAAPHEFGEAPGREESQLRHVLDELKLPPSSSRFCPTMKPILAEHRKAHASPNSAGLPTRPVGEFFARSCTSSSTGRLDARAASWNPPRSRSVRNGPGRMLLITTLWCATCRDSPAT